MNRKSSSISVVDESMYAKATKIYPREVTGKFQKLRTLAVFWLLGMFYLFPWLSWSGRQAVLFDLPARKFYIFGLAFWPQDFFYLSMLLMIAAFSLFFFTALAGRLWCGYACPQTVWTEVFIWIERWTEGSRTQQMKLQAAPWTPEKILRKNTKQILWIVFALWTGFTFVGFFTPIRELAQSISTWTLGGWELFWILFYGLATYGNAGYLREQVCKYMCPYARFQGAMFDANTWIIAYDEKRGEKRGARKKGTDYQALGLGDCVDCTVCVQVCPTGIDIRNGLQYECIACGACIDACNTVMDKLEYPRGLIRYSTTNGMENKPSRILRPRIVIYAIILMCLVGAFTWSLWHRVPLIVEVLRDRNALFRIAGDGSIENVYTIKIINKDQREHRYQITVDSGFPLAILGASESVSVPAEQGAEVPLTLHATGQVKGMHIIDIRVQSLEAVDIAAQQETRFFGPL